MDVTLVLPVAVLGALLGSFANVPIHRWPRGGTVTSPSRSACPACGHAIAARDNVPVVSWLTLRGRCRHCGAGIHWRYPGVEAATAILFGVVALVEGATWLLPALLALTWALVVATVIDLEHRIIPNRLTYPLPFVLLALLVPPTLLGPGEWADARRALLTAVLLPLGMLATSELFRLLRGRRGIGLGDVKLAVSLGLVVGYLGGALVVVLLYASVISAVLVAAVLLATGRARLASAIPFGPYLALGTMVTVLAGESIAAAAGRWLGVT